MSGPGTVVWSLTDSAVAGWRNGRRYGCPQWMIEKVTRLRAAGDWRAALGAARFDLDVDLADIAARYGTDVAARIGDDLPHLVPDLVRWHVPRVVSNGSGLIRCATCLVLATYPTGDAVAALAINTPNTSQRSQRLTLTVTDLANSTDPPSTIRWDQLRHRWDARHTDAVRDWLGGGTRTPFFTRDGRRLAGAELPTDPPPKDDAAALTEYVTWLQDTGRHVEAWAAVGVEVEPSARDYYAEHADEAPRIAHTTAVRALREFGATRGTELVGIRTGRYWYWHSGRVPELVLNFRGSVPALGAGPRSDDDDPDPPSIAPPVLWEPTPDLMLLRHGQLTPADLHPVVRAALFPGLRSTEPPGRAAPYVPPMTRVRCRGQWHEVGWRDGRLDLTAHTSEEHRRERTIASLGAKLSGCFAVHRTWSTGTGRLPKALRTLAWHAWLAASHGDTPVLERLLDAGLDPRGPRDRNGRGLLHVATSIGRPDLIARLIAAGLDVNAPDTAGRTPLWTAVFDGGPASLVRQLMAAGADPARKDCLETTALHVVNGRDAAETVGILVGAGLDPNAYDENGRTPLISALNVDTPAGGIRALLQAGADPGLRHRYHETSLREEIEYHRRSDLDFLLALLPEAEKDDEDDE